MDRTRFTKKGFEDMTRELEELRAQRPSVIADVSKAREMGDLKENGYYQASKQQLRTIDARMTRLSYYLKTGIVIEDKNSKGIGIGNTVTLEANGRELTYTFVGDLEADPSQKKLSLLSPIGKALEGKEQGMSVIVSLPAGNVTYLIKKVA